MSSSLFPFFEWAQNTGLGFTIRNSAWMFPLIDIVHLFGLILVFGSTIVLNLRLLGVFLATEPVPDIARGSFSWFWRGLAVSIPTGTLLFLASAIKCYNSPPFYMKMSLLGIAITFQTTVHRHLSLKSGPGNAQKIAAGTSLLLWFAIPALGFWIELY